MSGLMVNPLGAGWVPTFVVDEHPDRQSANATKRDTRPQKRRAGTTVTVSMLGVRCSGGV